MTGKSTSIQAAQKIISKLKTQIDSYQCTPEISTTQIDWGSKKRNQGKRYGSMIVGSMSAAPHGIKTYYGIDLSKYMNSEKEIKDIKYLKQSYERIRYDKARQFGCNHLEAMVYALTPTVSNLNI